MLLCRSFDVSCGKLLSDAEFPQMKNFDVKNNLLLVNKALLVVLTMYFSFVTTGRNVLCFQRFAQHLDQTLQKVANAFRNLFIHFKHFC